MVVSSQFKTATRWDHARTSAACVWHWGWQKRPAGKSEQGVPIGIAPVNVLTSTGVSWAWVRGSDTRNWKYPLKLFSFLI